MVTTLYIVFLSSLLAIMIMTVIAVKLYHDALKINPELKKLEQIKNEIGIANATLISLKQQVEGKNKELVSAEEIISKAETVKEFLEKFESEYNEKKGMIQILQDEIGVCPFTAYSVQKRIVKITEPLRIVRCIVAVDQLHQHTADILVAVEDLHRIIASVMLHADDLIGGCAEDKGILLADLLHDLHIGAVHGADRQRAV